MHHPISPLDGRYADRLQAQQQYFSEFALMRARCEIEVRYLLALDEAGYFEPLTTDEKRRIFDLIANFSDSDYVAIKQIENTTRHDVKSCEMFLRERLQLAQPNLIHFALTSEDVNNLAYSILLRDYLSNLQLPQIATLLRQLCSLAEQWAAIPFPTRTHGQKATPSTAGKEIAVFINRLTRYYEQLAAFRFSGKFSGAVGNYSAMMAALPQVDWLAFSQNFIASLQLDFNLCTTQIEDHDHFADYFNLTRQVNNIVADLNVDCWLYISRDLFSERTQAGEVGSSTMPHKVNPINFENSEGNIAIANSLLAMMSDKLTRSRMQRDLSDSTVQRNMGVALSHSFLAISESLRGLQKLQINAQNCLSELQNSPELLAEPIQTILKLVGIADPYELLKKHTRGQKTSREHLLQLVDSLPELSEELRQQIQQLRPENYLGDAERICALVVEKARKLVGA
jgi:adenylosuccinate lyase